MDVHRLLETFKCTECEQIRAIEDLAYCKFCGQQQDNTNHSKGYYCIRHCFETECDHALDCSRPHHKSCWEAHLPSVRSNNYKNHVQYSAADDVYVQLILYSEANKARQSELHQKDRNREWFRVTLARSTVQGKMPTLQVSDRFRSLCNTTGATQPPSFVSFVGDTGVGKSTMVRAMIMVGAIEAWKAKRRSSGTSSSIDLDELVKRQGWGPVTRSKNIDLANQPTSVGVHLYKDPHDVSVRYNESDLEAVGHVPVLFADCEGFRGGTDLTDAERGVRERVFRDSGPLPTRLRSSSTGSTQEVIVDGMDPKFIIKDCDITAPDFYKAGKESAELFYARFLYAFSDVVIFVTNEDQKLNDDMRRLLEWSATAMAKSIVQKSSKTLIIVVNGPKQHFNEWYDHQILKDKLFNNLGLFWQHSELLKGFVAEHNQTPLRADWIHDNQSLFEKLFQEVKMCYIPNKDSAPPDKLYEQYLHLRNIMLEGTRAGQRVRANSFDLYNVPAMWRLLDKAFDHFANSKEPFDIYTAARRDSPTPISVPGHIAMLLRLMQVDSSNRGRVVDLIACCMLVYTWRTYDLGREPKEIFDREIREKCQKAIWIYRQQIQQCEASMPDQERCILKFFEHREQHCDTKNQRTPGKFYVYGADSIGTSLDVIDEIQNVYISLYHATFKNAASDFRNDADTRKRLQTIRVNVFSKFRLLKTGAIDDSCFVQNLQSVALPFSTKTCLACLQSAPDHVLSCGHILCANCIKDFGTAVDSRRYCYHLDSCVLCCNADTCNNREEFVQLDSRFSGARILTLDGGGIRGIVELAILEKIMARIALPVSVRELFDLVVGTSTGGIIALALTMADTKLTVEDLKATFQDMARKTFENDRLSGFDFLKILPHGAIASVFTLLRWIKSRYDPARLQGVLQEVFKPDRLIFGDRTPEMDNRKARVAVTSTVGGSMCAFSNYSRYHFSVESVNDSKRTEHDDLVLDNELFRADEPTQGFKIWEAAMATAAAPLFFPPYVHEESGTRVPFKQTFVDGALHSNSPVAFALEEKDRIWPADQFLKPVDVLAAVGTGRQKEDDFALPKFIDVAGSGDVAKFYRNTIDSEKAWEKFKNRFEYNGSIHYRLNVDLESKVQLDQWAKMPELLRLVDEQYNESSAPGSLRHQIEEVADRLTAALFFYEPLQLRSQKREEYIDGQIWCRLQTPSEAFRRLLSRVEGFHFLRRKPNTNARTVELDFGRPFRNIRSSYLQSQQCFALPFTIECKGDGTEDLILYVKLSSPHGSDSNGGQPKMLRISGFPTKISRLKAAVSSRGIY